MNTLLVVIRAASGGGYFWPIWAITGWVVGLAFNAWAVYFEQSTTDEDIRREIERQHGRESHPRP